MTGKSKVVPKINYIENFNEAACQKSNHYLHFLITKADINIWFAALYSKAWMSEESIIVVYCF